jgi:O-antigen ligase
VLAVAAVTLLIGGVWISANPAVLQRIERAQEDRGNGREDLWLVARRMRADHPSTGVGLDNFRVRSPEYVRRPGSLDYVELVVDRPHEAHNTYLQMLAETGAVGLGLWLVLVVTAMASAYRAARRFERAGRRSLTVLSRGVLVGDVGLVITTFFITAQSTATVWVLIALGPILLGVSYAQSGARIGRSSGGIGYSSGERLRASTATIEG